MNDFKQFKDFWALINSDFDIFRQKIKVLKVNISQGKERTDKDGNLLYDNVNGEVLRWDDSYYLEFMCMASGEVHTARITQQQFLELEQEVNNILIAIGRVTYRSIKDAYNTIPQIIFTKFINFLDFVEQEVNQNVTLNELDKTLANS